MSLRGELSIHVLNWTLLGFVDRGDIWLRAEATLFSNGTLIWPKRGSYNECMRKLAKTTGFMVKMANEDLWNNHDKNCILTKKLQLFENDFWRSFSNATTSKFVENCFAPFTVWMQDLWDRIQVEVRKAEAQHHISNGHFWILYLTAGNFKKLSWALINS